MQERLMQSAVSGVRGFDSCHGQYKSGFYMVTLPSLGDGKLANGIMPRNISLFWHSELVLSRSCVLVRESPLKKHMAIFRELQITLGLVTKEEDSLLSEKI